MEILLESIFYHHINSVSTTFFVAKFRKVEGIDKLQGFFTKVLVESVVNFFTTFNFHHC